MANEPDITVEDSPKRRMHWSGRLGFILAATGSAIGLGNIWKFPYITGVYGGGAFVIVYLLCVVGVGLPLMIAELSIGRRAQQNPVGAFQILSRKGSAWQIPGWIGVAAGFVILSYYGVVAGWSIAYILKAMVGFSGAADQIQGQFGDLAGSALASGGWHTLFMAATIAIVAGGIRGGIERWAKILMPALFLLLLGLMIYGLAFTDGGSQAIAFLFDPDFSKLTTEGILSAMGHAFFTLSLGMGAMITYGSYMRSEARVVRDAIAISFLDTLIALMAGLAIFSLVFAFDLEPGGGPGLIFQTLPVLFAQTGPWISVPFFVLLTFAALTSSVSLLEVVVSYFIDNQGWSRLRATILMGGLIWIVGLFCAASSGLFNVFDVVSTNYMLPLGGLLTCLFAGWVMKDKTRSEEFGSSGMMYIGFKWVLRIITPIAILATLLHGLEILPFVDY